MLWRLDIYVDCGWLFSASRGSHMGIVGVKAKFGSNCGQDIRLRFGHDMKLFDLDFEADF